MLNKNIKVSQHNTYLAKLKIKIKKKLKKKNWKNKNINNRKLANKFKKLDVWNIYIFMSFILIKFTFLYFYFKYKINLINIILGHHDKNIKSASEWK